MASGKPVIALGRGGALETVPHFGGVVFDEPTVDGLKAAIARFENLEHGVSPADLQSHAQRFSEAEFVRKITVALELLMQSDGALPHTRSDTVLEEGL